MISVKVIYIPAGSVGNLALGLHHNVWGWVQQNEDLSQGKVDSVQPGDLIVFVTGNVQRSHTQPWSDVHLDRVVVTEVAGPLYRSPTQVWPGPRQFEYQVPILTLLERAHVDPALLGEPFLVSLRRSTSTHGVPEPAALPEQVLDPSVALTSLTQQPLSTSNTETDAVRQVKARLEQAALRRRLIGSNVTSTCVICGRTLPSKLMHVAHIKRRSECSTSERLNLANVMLACTLGCDSLFEHGFVAVANDGVVTAPRGNAHLESHLATVRGKPCAAHSPSSEPFFAWHRAPKS